jgi:Domain of unknown function (DUF4270)
MIHRFTHEWRKVFTLSATFLLAVFLIVACRKKDTLVGSSGIDVNGLLAAGAVDTFTLETYSVLDDSINTKNPLLNVLGEMNDPVFGKMKNSFYTQLRLEAANPDFGDTNDIVMDSMVLAMQFSNYTGKLTPQTFEVYEVNEDIESDTAVKYYEFSSLSVKPTNLVAAGQGTITPEPIADAIIDTISVQPQLRIQLDTNFAKRLIGEAESGGTNFTSNDNFLNYFKGLYIKTNNAPQAVGTGGIFAFNMLSNASKVTMYFRRWELVNNVNTLVKKQFDMVINGSSTNFNRVERDITGSKVEQALNNPSNGLVSFYTQVFGLRAAVKIPGLSNLPKTAIIHKAVLYLPIEYQTGSVYSPGSTVLMFEKLTEGGNTAVRWYTPTVSDFTKSVTQDIGTFAQQIVSGLKENKPIYISPSRISTSGDRVIFNGPNTTNKEKPKLYIIYTEF